MRSTILRRDRLVGRRDRLVGRRDQLAGRRDRPVDVLSTPGLDVIQLNYLFIMTIGC